MKISSILNEALVKVPETTLNEVLRFVVGVYFGQAISLHKKYNKPQSLEFKRAIKRATSKYGQFEIYDVDIDGAMRASVPYRVKELPKNYRKNLSKDFTIKVTAGGSKWDKRQGMYFHKMKGRAGHVNIIIPNLVNLMGAVNRPEDIDAQLIQIAGTVEHELMHATQDIAFKHIDKELFSVDYYNDDQTIDRVKHSLHELEFSPMVKTSATTFMHMVELMKNRTQVSQQDLMDYLRAFVDPTAKSPFQDGRRVTNDFFRTLHGADKSKWKKAVKYIHSLLRGYIDSF